MTSVSVTSASVSVIIPVKDDPPVFDAVASVLRSAAAHPGAEVIVVDNGSAPEFRSSLGNLTGVTILDEPVPGAGAARNAGIRAAHGEVLLFADADSVVAPDWVEQALAGLAATGADLLQGSSTDRVGPPTRAGVIIGAREAQRNARAFREDRYSTDTKNLAVRRQVFDRVLFDPAFYRREDWLFGEMAMAAGFRRAYWEPMRVEHAHDEALRLHLAKAVVEGWAKTAMRDRYGSPAAGRTGAAEAPRLRRAVQRLRIERPVAVAAVGVVQTAGWTLEHVTPPFPLGLARRVLPTLVAIANGAGAFMWRCRFPQPTVGEALGLRFRGPSRSEGDLVR